VFFLGILSCTLNNDHPQEDVEKMANKTWRESGHKPEMKYESLINLLYFGYTMKTKIQKSDNFYYFCFSLLVIQTFQNHLIC
jgi:hypothetical protein